VPGGEKKRGRKREGGDRWKRRDVRGERLKRKAEGWKEGRTRGEKVKLEYGQDR